MLQDNSRFIKEKTNRNHKNDGGTSEIQEPVKSLGVSRSAI